MKYERQTEFDWRDYAIRAGIILGGVIAAAIFVFEGRGESLAPLAIGGAIGSLIAGSLSAR